MWVPLKKKHKDIKRHGRQKAEEEFNLFLVFILLVFFLKFTETCHSDFVGINTKSALRDEGYARVPKIRDFTENSGKYSENPNF